MKKVWHLNDDRTLLLFLLLLRLTFQSFFSSTSFSGEGQNERTAVRIEVLLAFEAVLSHSDDDDDVDDVGVRAHMGVCVVGAADLLVAVF